MSLGSNAMACKKGENPNHPLKGSTIHVEPIRDKTAIKRIKKLLRDHPRDLCLFTLGINTAFRANELLALQVNQVEHLGQGDVLALKQAKTRKYRQVTLNMTVVEAIQSCLAVAGLQSEDYLFTGQRGVLTVPTVSFMVKRWCAHTGLEIMEATP
jgi:integrase